MITLDIPSRRLDVAISDEELARRRAVWQPHTKPNLTGWLKRYAAMVTSGSHGAVLEI